MKLRATLKIRNDRLIAAREASGMTIPVLVAKCQIGISDYYALQNLDFSLPNAERKALALSAVLGIPVEEILPDGAIGKKIESVHTKVLDVPTTQLLSARQEHLRLPHPSETLERAESVKELQKAIKDLTFREREILKLRYGLGDGESMTLEEVGRRFGVTRDRIRQIQSAAERKLSRNPRLRRECSE